AATLLALGGASWKRLGSTGEWTALLADKEIPLVPFQPSNCGFTVNWSDHLRQRFAGAPVKAVRLTAQSPDGPQVTRSEFVITETGLESGGIYTLCAALRGALARDGSATLTPDLVPDIESAELARRISRPRGKQSRSNHLRKTTGLSAVNLALLHEVTAKETLSDPNKLAQTLKALPIKITGTAPLDQAISTTGGVAWSALNDQLMLSAAPGVFCAGEMIDWDAPTGGYLITACLAMGRTAGQGAAAWLK
ncbi:MAG: TIGR03862 family flavoprotein, partial [Henriciella sp.]|nr:TIGR03862 family flavoprotein [Henriciella sp.]